MRLCGHATLAAAHVIFNHLGNTSAMLVKLVDAFTPKHIVALRCSITFQTLSGPLYVRHDGNNVSMRFPSHPPRLIEPNSVVEQIVEAVCV